MKKEKFKYDAFISYRHCELDMFVAENLHKILETYDLPKNLKTKLGITGKPFERVFRDQEELPLSSNLADSIECALNDSKYLIVICSPRLKESLWCKKEIQTFKKLRGLENIFCVLIEGDPSESFPEEVLSEEKVTIKNGKKVKEKVLVEPLAADVRGETKSEVLKKLKEEKLRLVAPVYNLNYDDLKQRHKLRRQKQIMRIAISVASFCILFTIYTLAMLIKINNQANVLSEYQSLSLANKAMDNIKNDNRHEAIKLSYQSLTRLDNGIKMSYTPEGEYALTESLGVYDVGASYKTVSELKTEGIATYIKTSKDNLYSAVYDESNTITLFNTKTLNVIKKDEVNTSFTNNCFSFIGNKYLAYIDSSRNIKIISTKDGSLVKEIKKGDESYSSIKGDAAGKYLAYISDKKLYIYNIKDKKVIGDIEASENYISEFYYSDNSEYIFAGSSKTSYDINEKNNMTMHTIRTKDAKETNSIELEAGYISEIITKDDTAYFLLNNSKGTDFNILAVSYNYIDNEINWTKDYENRWGKFIVRSYAENTNSIAISSHDVVNVIDASNGNTIESFNCDSEIINIYSFLNKEIYLVFTKNGTVSYINMEYKNHVEYKGKFEFNIDEYSKVVQSKNGFLLIPSNENRVILYEEKKNKDIKEENIKRDYSIKESIKLGDYEKITKKYKVKNKSLVYRMLYDDKKELLFVNYTNEDVAIYDVSSKKLLNYLTSVGKIEQYVGKDKYGRIYIGNISDSYILDKNYNKIGHIKGLYKVKKDKLYISDNNKIYSMKIYVLKDLLKEAKEYLSK